MADPREALADALKGFLTEEQTKLLVDEVLAITKKARGEFNCKKCNARQYQYVDIPDAKSVSSALTDLMNQGFGRPSEASVLNVEPVRFLRLTNMGELDEVQGSRPSKNPKRNVKVRKGQVARQAGAASRGKSVD